MSSNNISVLLVYFAGTLLGQVLRDETKEKLLNVFQDSVVGVNLFISINTRIRLKINSYFPRTSSKI